PLAEVVPHAFFPEYAAQITIVLEKRVLSADDEDDVHGAQGGQLLAFAEVGQEMAGGVEVDAFVVIAVVQIAEMFDLEGQIVASGKGAELAKQVRVAKGDVGGIESAQAAAMGDSAGVRVFCGHERQHFVEDVF